MSTHALTHEEVADDYVFRARLLELLKSALVLLDKLEKRLEEFE